MGGFGQALQALLGAGGASGPGGVSDPSGEATSAMSAELHGSDPSMLLRRLQKCKQELSQIFVEASFRIPNAAGNVAQAMTKVDRAIKELQQAANTASVVRPPIGFSLAGQPGAGAGAPSIGAGLVP